MNFNLFDTISDVVKWTPKLFGRCESTALPAPPEVGASSLTDEESIDPETASERLLHSDYEMSQSTTPDFRALDRQTRWKLANDLSHSLRYV